jgi:ubiquinol-cytochrome c reductase iron-sulfur subunit
MNPDASVKALASTEVDVSSVKPGNTITVLWRGKPVLSEEELKKKFLKLDQLKWRI